MVKNKVRCPECSKSVVEVHRYQDGDALYVHEKKLIKGVLPHYDITNSCYIKKEK